MQKVLGVESFELEKFLTQPKQLFHMILQGVKNDRESITKALTLKFSERTPFVIDPNSEMLDYIIKEKNKDALQIQFQEKSLQSKFELGLKFGKTVLVT